MYSFLCSKDLKRYDRYHAAKDTPRVLHCIATSYCDILRPSASICMYLAQKARLMMNAASSAPVGRAWYRSNSQAATLQSSSAAFRISKIPTTRLHFPALVQLFFRLYSRIMASSRGKRATHSITTTLLNSAGAGASISVAPGQVDGPRSTSKRETECYYQGCAIPQIFHVTYR